MNLLIIVVHTNYLRNKNESNDKKRKRDSRKGRTNRIDISNK